MTRVIVGDGTSMTWERLVQSVSDVPGIVFYSGHAITHSTVRAEVGIRGEQPIIDEMAPLCHVRKQNAYLWRMLKIAEHTSVTLYELDGFDHSGTVEPGHKLLLNFLENAPRE